MHEELVIRQFGPLKDIHLPDIRPIVVVVGASGSGKSLLLKVLTMMRHVAKLAIIQEALKASGVKQPFAPIQVGGYLAFGGFSSLLQQDTLISYRIQWEDGSCTVTLANGNFQIASSLDNKTVGPFLKIAFISDLRNLIPLWAQKGATVQSKVLDSYFMETFSLWEDASATFHESTQELPFLDVSLLLGKNNGDPPHVLLKDEKRRMMPWEMGASGYKSSVPLAMIVRHLMKSYDYFAAIKRSYLEVLISDLMAQPSKETLLPKQRQVHRFCGNFLCIHVEEPELSLDPDTQIRLAEELMQSLSWRREDIGQFEASIIFTTHSPYWIVALNTLLQENAYTALTWEKIDGYLVTPQGTLKSLRDDESQLLMTPNMDKATSYLRTQEAS